MAYKPYHRLVLNLFDFKITMSYTGFSSQTYSLKQQSVDVAQLGHIILNPSQPVFALSP
jgi:hypothetical protein